jgi:hypothetical protein
MKDSSDRGPKEFLRPCEHRFHPGLTLRTAVLGFTLLLAGCHIYLHDDSLQKKTDAVLANYKVADISGAMQSALTAQTQLDQSELQSLVDIETAERERAVADLISTYPTQRDQPGTIQAIGRLNFRVNARIKDLVNSSSDVFDAADWLDIHEKLVSNQTLADSFQPRLIARQRAYTAAGGSDFTSCDTFSPSANLQEPVKSAARQLKAECDNIKAVSQQGSPLQATIDKVLKAKGDIGTVHTALESVTKQIADENKAKSDTLKQLQAAQKLVNDANSRPNSTTDVIDKLKDLNNLLNDVDKAAGILGDPGFSPGQALAAIQFRKTNLRDVLAATASTGADQASSGSSSSGAPSSSAAPSSSPAKSSSDGASSSATASSSGAASPADSTSASNTSSSSSPASDMSRAIVGVIAGLIDVTQTSSPPSPAALSVALAYQDGLQKAVQAHLDALTQKQTLLQDEENSLLRELELLAVAKVAGQKATKPLTSKDCNPLGFADVFSNTKCSSAGRAAAARALAAYNLSWAAGRTAAHLDDRKITQQITWEKLRAAQEAAVAREKIQTIALTEVAAFGQGGVKPETIAAFLQALGIAAIAKGVN